MAGSLDRRVGALSAMEEWNVRRSYDDCFRRVEREPMLRAILKARIGIKPPKNLDLVGGVCGVSARAIRTSHDVVGFNCQFSWVFLFSVPFRVVFRSLSSTLYILKKN